MIKHVGKHNNKKCIILFRQVPGEDHMCLVVYPETLPRHIHDDVMSALESEAGQQAKEFSDYLFRFTMSDGNNSLQTLHQEGMIKKVPTNQVIVTPNAKSTVRLDELNDILNKMDAGEQAIKEMAELDRNAGMSGKRRRVNEGRDMGELRAPRESRSTPANVENNISINDVLSSEDLSKQRLAQAQKLQNDARALLAEAARLQEEALSLNGPVTKNGATKSKKTAKAKEA
jgi:hypothetical protein